MGEGKIGKNQNYRATVGNFVTIISAVLSAKPSGTSHLVLSRDKKFEGKTKGTSFHKRNWPELKMTGQILVQS